MTQQKQEEIGWLQATTEYLFGKVPTLDERIATSRKGLVKLRDEYEDHCEEILYEQKRLEKKMNSAAQRQAETELKRHAREYVRFEREYADYNKEIERTAAFLLQVDKLKTDATFNQAFLDLARIMDMPIMANNGLILQGVARLQQHKEKRKLLRSEMDDALAFSSEEDEEDEETNDRVKELVNEKLCQANATLIEKLPMIRALDTSTNKNKNPDLVAQKVEQFLAKK